MRIDWDKLHALLPVYAYEYETPGITNTVTYWWPHMHPAGTEPPAGWTGIDRDESYENLSRAISEYLKLQPTEKAVWFNNATGEFSNSWPYDTDDKTVMDALKYQLDGKNPDWKLIVYRCESDANFEFMGLMKIVTNTERRK